MSKYQWTEEQARAIELRDKNLLVSAAAGSGKTALLTERLKQLVLKDQIDCTKILVLTFTKAAAAEMKQRFKNNLYGSIHEGEWNLNEQQIIDQINAINDSQISTIDSFANNMVRRYFESAGIDPSFRIADDSELSLITDETIDEVFEELFLKAEENDEMALRFLDLIDLYGGSKSNEGLKKILKDVLTFFESLPYPDIWIKKAVDRYDSADQDIIESDFFTSFVDDIKGDLYQAIKGYKHLDLEFENIPYKEGSKIQSNFRNEIDRVLALEDKSTVNDIINGLNAIVFGMRFPKETDSILQDNIKKIRNESKNILDSIKKKIKTYDLDQEIESVKMMNDHFKTLIEVYRKVEKLIHEKKAAARILSFSDLEKTFLKILDDPKVQQDLQEEYDYIFLDEYQDTNGVQEEIIKKIERGNNRFMVGDLRQAIYGFRNADPEIFLNKYDKYQLPENEHELILLNKNFRSSPQVINGINNIFEKIMSRKLGNIQYDDSAKLIANRTDETPIPEIHLVSEEILDNEESKDKVRLQARFIAKKIRELVSNPNENINYSDIAILLRSVKSRAKAIMEVFAEEGIPIIFDGDTENVETQEISLFLKLLNLIDNHKQDLPLLSVLHLPIFDFTLDDEVEIRKTYPDEPYFYQAVEKYRDEQNNRLSQKLNSFYTQLEEWRRASKHLELEDFLWKLLLESKYYDYVGGLAGGKERKQNLRLLLERAISYKDSSLKGLSSFLQYADRLKKRGQIVGSSVNGISTSDAVKLMSIHKSKGLEFPVVILADISKQFNTTNAQDIILHKDNVYAPKKIKLDNNTLIKNKSIFNDALHERIKQEEYSEEMRLLYVALTRAMNRLILVGTINKEKTDLDKWKEGTKPEQLFKKRTFRDWVMSAIYSDRLFDQKLDDFETDFWKINYVDSLPLETEEVLEKQDQDEFSEYEKLRDQIYSKLNAEKKEIRKNIPIKMSVSRLKKHGIQRFDEVELSDITKQKVSDFSPAEIGTAVHMLLQHIDLDSYLASDDKDYEIERQKELLTSQGIIDQQIKEVIDEELITDFFESDLGKRLLQAYKKDRKSFLKEVPFSLDLKPEELSNVENVGNRTIQATGIIDGCFLEDDHWILIDYKTDHFYSKKDVQHKLDEYAVQLGIYALALEKLTGLPVKEKHLYFLSEKQDFII